MVKFKLASGEVVEVDETDIMGITPYGTNPETTAITLKSSKCLIRNILGDVDSILAKLNAAQNQTRAEVIQDTLKEDEKSANALFSALPSSMASPPALPQSVAMEPTQEQLQAEVDKNVTYDPPELLEALDTADNIDAPDLPVLPIHKQVDPGNPASNVPYKQNTDTE